MASPNNATDHQPTDETAASTERISRDRIISARAAEQNRLLASLSVDDYERVLGELRPVRLDERQVLIEANTPIADVWFLRSGVGSMIAAEQRGGSVEVGTIGREGMIGLPILHEADRTSQRVLIQVAGDGWRMSAEAFRQLIDDRPAIRRLCLRYAQVFLDQVAQSVACNGLHTLGQRCARWLLTVGDRVDGDSFNLTQEFLAGMLGVRRAGVSVAMGELQRLGIVKYARGEVHLLDRLGLEAAACDCYRITRRASNQLFAAEGDILERESQRLTRSAKLQLG